MDYERFKEVAFGVLVVVLIAVGISVLMTNGYVLIQSVNGTVVQKGTTTTTITVPPQYNVLPTLTPQLKVLIITLLAVLIIAIIALLANSGFFREV
jgi:hypothetical protein